MNEHFSSISDKEAKDISVVFMKIYGAEDVHTHIKLAGLPNTYSYVRSCSSSSKQLSSRYVYVYQDGIGVALCCICRHLHCRRYR